MDLFLCVSDISTVDSFLEIKNTQVHVVWLIWTNQKTTISGEDIVKLIDEMVVTGKIERIVQRFEPAVTYIK